MKILLSEKANEKPKNIYVIDIETMEGGADDEHHIVWHVKDVEELRDMIIHTEVMMKCYSNGRGGGDEYVGPYFEKYFQDSISCDDYGYTDSIESYKIVYYDKNGNEFNVQIEMDDEMKEEIKNPKMSEEDKKEMNCY